MDIENVSVRELILKMKIGQLWAIIVVIAGLITGSFTMGYKYNDSRNELKLISKEFELKQYLAAKDLELKQASSKLEEINNNLGELRKKDRFLSLFLRYEQARRPQERQAAKKALDSYINKFIDDADKAESKVKIGKGSGLQTTINFSDGSTWTVPPDFSSATRH
jgi:nitrate/nitrite-specific signal transduction histidine kinase